MLRVEVLPLRRLDLDLHGDLVTDQVAVSIRGAERRPPREIGGYLAPAFVRETGRAASGHDPEAA